MTYHFKYFVRSNLNGVVSGVVNFIWEDIASLSEERDREGRLNVSTT